MDHALLGIAGILLASVPFGVLGVTITRRFVTRSYVRDDEISVFVVAALAAFLLQAEITTRFNAMGTEAAWVIAGSLGIMAVAAVYGLHLRTDDRDMLIREKPWGLLVVVAVALAVAAPFVVLILESPRTLVGSTPWYYWSLAQQTAAIGGLPTTSVEWGREVAFLADYPAFTSATAAVMELTGSEQLSAAHLMRMIAVFTTGLGSYALARAWGARRITALAAVFGLLATEVFVIKLSSYRPEAFGYGLMLLVPALFKRFLATGNRVFAVFSGLGFLTLSQIHGLTFTFCGILLIATAIVEIAADPRRRTLKEVAIGAANLVGFWAIGSFLLRGRLSDIGKLNTAPTIDADGIDPTWVFASFDTQREGLNPPALTELLRDSFGRGFAGLSSFWFVAATVVVLVAAAVLAQRGSRQTRRLLAVVALVVVGTLLFSAIWFVGWETYVPRRTGAGRVVQLTVLLLPLAAAVTVSAFPVRRTRENVTAVFATLAVVAWIAGIAPLTKINDIRQPRNATLASQRAIELPPGLALGNAYSEGYIPAVLGVDGLLDGRAPYTEADVLERANELREEARSFFAEPTVDGFDFDGYDVHYVIASNERWALGTSWLMQADLAALDDLPNLELLRRGDGYRLYRVVPVVSQ